MAQPAIRSVRVTLSDNGMEPHEVQLPANYPIRFIVDNVGAQIHQLRFRRRDIRSTYYQGKPATSSGHLSTSVASKW